MAISTPTYHPLHFSPTITTRRIHLHTIPFAPRKALLTTCARRTGKRRYPSEKKKLEKIKKELLKTKIRNREEGYWRLSKLSVPAHKDPGKDFIGVSLPLLEAIAKILKFPVAPMLPEEAFTVVRKSFDARKVLKEPAFVYTVDMDVKKLLHLEPRTWDFISYLEPKLGFVEYREDENALTDLVDILDKGKVKIDGSNPSNGFTYSEKRPRVAVVGSGPSGLFAALVLGEIGADVTLIERGQPVEQRGRDIGALVVRKILSSESNFCFGEGGAGTWSDGKLVTRIGRNSDSVQAVLKTLAQFGAPPNILVDGKPHLGTDKLVPLLRNFRHYLLDLGVDIKFNTRLDNLVVENGQVKGVVVSNAKNEPGCNSDQEKLLFDAVVLAVGHSARDVYSMLLQHNIEMVPKNFAVGLRIEHPQELINSIQYSELANEVQAGRGRIPVADYKVAKYVGGDKFNTESSFESGVENRSCYSFCMCPGGQVVLTSTNPSELCINGMSFSRRASKWANSALVVTVSSDEFDSFRSHGPLAGVEFQREFERRAAEMGGGNFVVPAQRVTDFLAETLSGTSLPASSYRLGVKASRLHNLFPAHITKALQCSIEMFDKELPGFITTDALLHGVETRTSSPVQISRQADTCESTSLKGLYPIGEGAGYAGGIVSAAVDGMFCGFALAKELSLYRGDVELVLRKAQKQTGFVKY
ncbi:FAD/NAD(P)-binding oxidoreductase family protein [Rhynchospora pubera]|uniref:FAD/NAD(P)-binding oxidoreductase family protein n=1 Tax=Rhynchospora pubera TaxID=906938 RepID=A0AAV8GMR4_9POAL|nr:FAD/NAD(P)-binding oxidoreductase family protein [Rhynchospora pubera]